ncbi:hypothetical protein WOC76_07995 [Methylocystis sp. IM3]|jgi:hypothetical protein|uniref:hypothetical protein n=1 Tax=unclassified Methylocystis TaxID=2625913 RepID=UPI000FA182C3|nr:MAG: hypothetical protein EKK29_02695 [Hyphomicrobiales bacterium]
MIILALTSLGLSQKLLIYQRMADALAQAVMTPPSEADKARIYRMPSAVEKQGGVSLVGLSKGVFVGGVVKVGMISIGEGRGAQAAKAQLLAAMAPGMLGEGQKARR